jgi:cell division GTPase FtsZ
MTNEAESSAKIIVIGVGGAGNNAVTGKNKAGTNQTQCRNTNGQHFL